MAKKARKKEARAKRRFDLAQLPLWLLIVLPPLTLSLTAKDNFRLPKLLVSELLAVLCILVLLPRLRRVERVDWRQLWGFPVLRAVVPILLVASATWLTSASPVHTQEGLISLWIGGLTLIALALALTEKELQSLLRGWIGMATVLSILVVVQAYVFNPFQYEGDVNRRIGLTSLAGGPFDLSGYLVLPLLWLQWELRERWNQTKIATRAFLLLLVLLLVFAVAQSQTLTALLAIAAGSLIFWGRLLPKKRFVAGLAIAVVLGSGLVIGLDPLRNRLERKVDDLREGRINDLLTGRLDGWHGALWMWRQAPLLGVGHGAYRTQYGTAKLDLSQEGTTFSKQIKEPYFIHAHSEFFHILAEWGSLGFLALLWTLFILWRQARARARDLLRQDRASAAALLWAGLVAILLMATINFPFHIALIAYPLLVFLSWILNAPKEAAS